MNKLRIMKQLLLFLIALFSIRNNINIKMNDLGAFIQTIQYLYYV